MKTITNILDQLYPLPNLTLFWWNGRRDTLTETLPRFLLERFDSLREISGLEVDTELLQTKYAYGLLKVIVPTNLETLMTVRDNLPALTHVNLSLYDPPSSTPFESIETISKAPKHLRWKHLICRSTVSPHILQFLPNLESLAIAVAFIVTPTDIGIVSHRSQTRAEKTAI
ncbi:hypothetical protein CPB86DRAFT_878844 [Serendipita vermifera]|nr:hypothetical protein CPB86DRAFT_878844 [Serendipita vermifera]